LPRVAQSATFMDTYAHPTTLYEKIWKPCLHESGKPAIIYMERHLMNEGTYPQAFAALKDEGAKSPPRPDFAEGINSVSDGRSPVANSRHRPPTPIRSTRAQLPRERRPPFEWSLAFGPFFLVSSFVENWQRRSVSRPRDPSPPKVRSGRGLSRPSSGRRMLRGKLHGE